jgi:hypothetical protein
MVERIRVRDFDGQFTTPAATRPLDQIGANPR